MKDDSERKFWLLGIVLPAFLINGGVLFVVGLDSRAVEMLLPCSIIVAGALIAGAIVISARRN